MPLLRQSCIFLLVLLREFALSSFPRVPCRPSEFALQALHLTPFAKGVRCRACNANSEGLQGTRGKLERANSLRRTKRKMQDCRNNGIDFYLLESASRLSFSLNVETTGG